MDNVTLVNYIFSGIALAVMIAIAILFIYLSFKYMKEKYLIDAYLFENLERISEVQRRIYNCTTLEEFDDVKRWAIASADNMYDDMVTIAYETGDEEGKKLVKDIKHRLSIKEEELSRP